MRIGIDARMFGPESTTGIGAYIKNLIEELLLIDNKNEYVLFLKEPVYSSYICPNERVKKVKVDIPWYSLSEQLKFPFILFKENLDLVHFPHFNAAVFYPKKFIVTVHDITPRFFPGPLAKKNILRRIGYNLVFKLSVLRAKKIITISEHTKNNLINYYKINPNKIEITYLGVNDSFQPVTDSQQLVNVKNKYRISKPFILYLGVWRDHKNLPNLIHAFEILKKGGLDAQLVLGGQPDERYPEINLTIEKSEFKEDIVCPGFVDQIDLPALYTAAEIFALPSFCEGFGLVALEALSCNTPVVASNTTSLPEILKGNAKYFDPHNSKQMAEVILNVLSDELYRKNVRNGYQELSKIYKWKKTAEETLNIYTKT